MSNDILHNSIWLRHPNWPDYGISPEGNVLSFKRNKILKPILMPSGDLRIMLSNKGKNKQMNLDRLVASIFCENKDGHKFVLHKNGNKKDCRAENLEYRSYTERGIYIEIPKQFKDWKVYPKAPNYLVSINGDVVNLAFGCKQVLCRINKYGYKIVALATPNNRSRNFLVHRLIAELYIPNSKNLPVINHIDGNKLNNTIENLEWCTQQTNCLHRNRVLMKNVNENHHNAKLSVVDVNKIRDLLSGKKITHKEIAKLFNVSRSTITNINNDGWRTI